jgi:hypothetical protein
LVRNKNPRQDLAVWGFVWFLKLNLDPLKIEAYGLSLGGSFFFSPGGGFFFCCSGGGAGRCAGAACGFGAGLAS